MRCLLSQIHDELQLELLVGTTHVNSTMSLNSSSSSSNSSQTQLVAAADQPHPPVRNSTSSLKDSPILRSLSRKSQKLQASRQENNIPDNFEPTSVISIEDTCVVDRVSHGITIHKPLNDHPKEESMDYNIQQQPKESLGRSDSERSLMDEEVPVCSCDQQPLHSDREPVCDGQEGKLQDNEDMETNQDYDKSATATVKKRILEEANKSVCLVCVPCVCVFGMCVRVCVCVCVCAHVCCHCCVLVMYI